MPRTKNPMRSRNPHSVPSEESIKVEYFELTTRKQQSDILTNWQMRINSIERSVDVAVNRLPLDIRSMTLRELIEQMDKENRQETSSENSRSQRTTRNQKRNTGISDDGYVTESGARTSRTSQASMTVSKKIKHRPKSVKPKPALQKSRMETSLLDKGQDFKTPAVPRSNNEYGLITPKIKPNAAMSVLRRPRQGEMVLSMQGSPLLVSSIVQENTANVNVPLNNGNVVSLLPKNGLRLSNIPNLDEDTVQQLQTLKSHIEKVISMK